MLTYLIKLYKKSFSGLPKEIWILSLVMLVNRAGAMVIPFLSLFLSNSKGFSFIQIGGILTFYGLGSFIGNYVGGRLVDRLGQYYVQIFALLGAALSFTGLTFLNGFWEFAIGVFILSSINDTFRPANLSAMALYSSPELQTRAITLNRLAINLGFSIGPGMAGILAESFGYNVLFYLDSISCVLAASLILFALPRKEVIRKKKEHALVSGVEILKRDPFFLKFLLLGLPLAFSFIQLFYTVPVFLESDLLLSESSIGKLMALNGFLIFAIEMPLVYLLEERSADYLKIVTIGAAGIGLSYLFLVGYGPLYLMGLLFIITITLGEILALPFQASFILHRAEPELRGTYMGLYGMMWSLAQVIAPALGFWLAEGYGFSALWLLCFVIILFSCLGFGILRKNKKKIAPNFE